MIIHDIHRMCVLHINDNENMQRDMAVTVVCHSILAIVIYNYSLYNTDRIQTLYVNNDDNNNNNAYWH